MSCSAVIYSAKEIISEQSTTMIIFDYNMRDLNFPEYEFSQKTVKGKTYLFDAIRKKYILLTPEEWVRQHCIKFLIEKGYPAGLIQVEREIRVFNQKKRVDILAYDLLGKVMLLVECKAPGIPISQKVIDQAARYNIGLGVPYLMVTNGLEHLCCHIDYENEIYKFLSEIPLYEGDSSPNQIPEYEYDVGITPINPNQ